MKKILSGLVALTLMTTFVAALTIGYLGDSIYGSLSVVNPSNVLTLNSEYAILEHTLIENLEDCPPGDIGYESSTLGCYEEDSSWINFRAWEIIDFDGPVESVDEVKYQVGNFDDGCYGELCGETIGVTTYYTNNLDGSNTDWHLIGGVYEISPVSIVNKTHSLPSVDVDAVLVVNRNIGLGSRPDPRLYWVLLFAG